MVKQLTDLMPPPDATLKLSEVFAKMYGDMESRTKEVFFPSVIGDESGTNKLVTMHNPTNAEGEHKRPLLMLHTRNSTGLPAVIAGLHTYMRGQASDLNLHYIDAVKEEMKKVVLPFPGELFQHYIDVLRAGRANVPPEKTEQIAIIDAYIDRTQAFLDSKPDTYTLYEESELLMASFEPYAALRSGLNAAMSNEDMRRLNRSLEHVFGGMPEDFKKITSVTLTFQNAAGVKESITVPNEGEKPIAGVIYGSIGGKIGFANHQRLPHIWSSIAGAIFGATDSAAEALHDTSEWMGKQIQAQFGYDDQSTHEILTCSSFNLSVSRWNSLHKMLQTELPSACFQEYVTRMALAKTYKAHLGGQPFYQISDIVDSMNHELTTMGAEENELLHMPTVDELVPRTRFDYYGLLSALANLVPSEHLNEELDALKAVLCPAGENNVLPTAYAQQSPDPMQMVRIKNSITALKESYAALTEDKHLPTTDTLFAIADREVERGRKIG